MKKALLFALIVGGLTACGGNVKNMESIACSGLDWKKVGFDAVADNQPVRYFDKYKNACGDRLEEGAIKLYQDGYAQAAVEVCTEKNGFKFGMDGREKPVVCLFELKEKFETGYAKGDLERRERIEKLKRISEENVAAPTKADMAEQRPGHPH